MASSLPIDVIVPAYNAVAFLRESLASVATQTCAVNTVIVVDDGSTDGTAELARSLGATVVSQANRGLAEARNAGVRASTAPYLALLDADDRWHPERLEAQWLVREARPDALVIATDYALWTGAVLSGPVLGQQAQFIAVPRERISAEAYVVSSAAMLAAIAVRNFVLPSSMLLDRQIFDRDGLYYSARENLAESDDTFIGEDYEWLLRVLRVTPVAFVDRVLVDYRQSEHALSARRGRIRHGDVVLGEMIAASPESYVAGAADAFARARPRMLRESALAHVKSGEFPFAAARLRDIARDSRQPARSIAKLAARLVETPIVQRSIDALTRLRRSRLR